VEFDRLRRRAERKGEKAPAKATPQQRREKLKALARERGTSVLGLLRAVEASPTAVYRLCRTGISDVAPHVADRHKATIDKLEAAGLIAAFQ
jgi:hypothetical protein